MKEDPSTACVNVFSDDDAAAKTRLREAILRHVLQYPNAADTANAIVKWWLPHTGYEDSPRHLEAVLEDMVNKHWLRREVLPDGEILYLRGDACGI